MEIKNLQEDAKTLVLRDQNQTARGNRLVPLLKSKPTPNSVEEVNQRVTAAKDTLLVLQTWDVKIYDLGGWR